MDHPDEMVKKLLEPYIEEASDVNIFLYPGTRVEFADNLINMGADCCLMQFSLRFKESLIDLDLLFYVVDIVKTVDGCIIFYSPESRVLDMKIIRRGEKRLPKSPGINDSVTEN